MLLVDKHIVYAVEKYGIFVRDTYYLAISHLTHAYVASVG
jgi:hypothetical protein